ncbi:MAG TPA: ribonuclease P protein component, partial [Gammaproteobacteria bacterium]
RAVDRNRIKRQIREFFRQHQASCKGLDLVIISRPAVVTADNRMLTRCLGWLWQKLEERCAA